jgi:MFS superfamily sulfate permease-like transporter
MIALVGVLVVPTLQALGIAVVISLGMLVWRASQARMTFLGRARGGLEPVDLRAVPDAEIPGLLIVCPDEMLFFANVAAVRDGILQAVVDAESPPTVVLLDLVLTPEVDVPVVEAVEDLHQRLVAEGIELWLCHLQPGARDLLDRAGTLATIGPDRIHARAIDGMVAFALRAPGAEERVAVVTELVAFIHERAMRPDMSAEGAELLAAFEERLSLELAAAGGPRGQASTG